jgi:hypothetical protein
MLRIAWRSPTAARHRRLLEQHAGELGQALDDQRAGKDRMPGEVIDEHVVGERHALQPVARSPGRS